MEVLLKSGVFKRKKFKVYSNNVEDLEEISNRFNIPIEKLLNELIVGSDINTKTNHSVEDLRNEINRLLIEMFFVESKWAGMRYRAYLYIKENKSFAITLAGVLAKNKNMRNLMGKNRDHQNMWEIVDKYLWMR